MRRFDIAAVALVILFLAGAGQTRADYVHIDDVEEGPPIVTTDSPNRLTIISISDETVHITFQEPLQDVGAGFFFADFLEKDGSLSDRIVGYQSTTGLLDVMFTSDPATQSVPDGAFNLGTLIEDGTFQIWGVYHNGDAGPDTNYAVRSDVDSVPEPAAMVLFTIGIVGMAGYGWRKRKLAVA
jgi:hypothetical protein